MIISLISNVDPSPSTTGKFRRQNRKPYSKDIKIGVENARAVTSGSSSRWKVGNCAVRSFISDFLEQPKIKVSFP